MNDPFGREAAAYIFLHSRMGMGCVRIELLTGEGVGVVEKRSAMENVLTFVDENCSAFCVQKRASMKHVVVGCVLEISSRTGTCGAICTRSGSTFWKFRYTTYGL